LKAKGEGTISIKLSKGKIKLSLICETDLMAERWRDALQQGKSGAVRAAATASARPNGPVLKLKAFIPVEDIEEYTEEDEMRAEGPVLALVLHLCSTPVIAIGIHDVAGAKPQHTCD
jgi:hypothetical protein